MAHLSYFVDRHRRGAQLDRGRMMPLTIEDEDTMALARTLAARLGRPAEVVVKEALQEQLTRLSSASVRAKLDALYARHPLPESTGDKADKAFFDALSGEQD